MAPDVGVASKSSAGKNGGTSRHTLKKGPWTAAEDAILMEYVKKHGEGNWNAVQRNSGLMRCGKSCRLRWANHLRPNLKKGAFSSEEEALIVELHAKLGNKWARMAAQLPGRTDNEIKNYWNTRLKRRQRAGLPIYPHDVNVKAQHHHQQAENSQGNPTPSSLVALLSPPPPALNPPGYSTPLSLFDIFTPSSSMKPRLQQPNASYLPNPNQHFKIFQENNGGLALSLSSSSSPFSSSSGPLPINNQSLPNSLSIPSIQYNYINFGSDSTLVSGVSFEQSGVVSVLELPSIQSLVPTTTPTSSTNNNASDYMIGTSSDVDDHEANQGFSRGNSGLLEDLIDESQALSRSEKSKQVFPGEDKSQENYLWDYKVMEGLNFNQENITQDKQIEDSSPAHSSIRANTRNGLSEESNPVDDYFLSLLDNFPLTVPLPEWSGDGNDTIVNGQSFNSGGGGEDRKENQQESSNSLVGTTPVKGDHNFDIESCCWKNMPGVYHV